MSEYNQLRRELAEEIVDHKSSIEYFHNYALYCENIIMWLRIVAALVGSGGLVSLVANKDNIGAQIVGGLFLVISVVTGVLIQYTPFKKRKDKIDIVQAKLINIKTWAENEYDKLKVSKELEEKKVAKAITLKKSLNKKIEEADEHWHGVKIPKCTKILKKADLEVVKYARAKFPEDNFFTEYENE